MRIVDVTFHNAAQNSKYPTYKESCTGKRNPLEQAQYFPRSCMNDMRSISFSLSSRLSASHHQTKLTPPPPFESDPILYPSRRSFILPQFTSCLAFQPSSTCLTSSSSPASLTLINPHLALTYIHN